MEWGTLITIVVAVYLVWYGLNFLLDLFIGGKPKIQPEQGVQYNLNDLMAEEEQARVVHEKDYEEPAVMVYPAAVAPSPDVPNSGGSPQSTAAPDPTPASDTQEQPISTLLEDWASWQDQEEKVIEISIQGQPIPVIDFIQSFKNEAKYQAASIFS